MSVAFASILEGAYNHRLDHLGTRIIYTQGNVNLEFVQLFLQAALNGWTCPHTKVKYLGPGVRLVETTRPELLSKVYVGSARTSVCEGRTAVDYRDSYHIAIPGVDALSVEVERVVAIVYTRERYMEDPDVTVLDVDALPDDAEHVVVAFQAVPVGHPAGPAPLSAARLQANMAGGNPAFFKTEEELEAMSAEEARAHIKMLQSAAADGKSYQEEWCVVGWN